MTPSLMMKRVIRRAAPAGLLSVSVLLSSCEIFTPPPPPPPVGPFAADGRPRYGFQGTQSPNYQEAPPALPGNNSTPQNKPVRINRDPNNTTVDIAPPPPRTTKPDIIPPPSIPSTPADATVPVTPSTPSTPANPPASKPSSRDDLPFGTPVVGKKGFVYSPYAEDKGYVDVETLKRGTRVKCPYTGKHFRVP
jgi:hypothetical protein